VEHDFIRSEAVLSLELFFGLYRFFCENCNVRTSNTHSEAKFTTDYQESENLKAESQTSPSKTAKGSGAAMDKRLEEWKGEAAIMAKVAYQCGLEDRKGVIRKTFEKLAAGHGGLSSTALELLRSALPDVAKKTPGVPKTI
jgi:hypothetical protein